MLSAVCEIFGMFVREKSFTGIWRLTQTVKVKSPAMRSFLWQNSFSEIKRPFPLKIRRRAEKRNQIFIVMPVVSAGQRNRKCREQQGYSIHCPEASWKLCGSYYNDQRDKTSKKHTETSDICKKLKKFSTEEPFEEYCRLKTKTAVSLASDCGYSGNK